MNIDELLTRCNKYKLISFDVFDTLVSRECFLPHGVFYLTSWKARRHKMWVPNDYPAARIKCEVLARKNTKGEEICLGDVHQELCNHYGPERAGELKSLLSLEKTLEISVAYPIVPLQHVIESISPGKTILTSDMYLDKGLIEAILARANYSRKYSRLFLSCEEGATKRIGTLFDRLVASTGNKPSEILHVGDHPLSDFNSPRKVGLSAWHLNWTKASDHEANLYDEVGQRLGSGESQRLFLELFVGAMKKARLSRVGLQKAEAEGRFRLGFEVVGPILFSYVYWILHTAANDSVRKLYFVARDGQILLEIARKIMPRMGISIDLRYLYGSRQAWNLPSLQTVDENSLSWILQKLPHITLSIISKRIEIDGDLLHKAYIEQFGDEITKNEILNDTQTANVRSLFLSGRLDKEILASAASARASLLDYLKKESVLSDPEVAIVDLGWQGRLQDALLRVLEGHGHHRITGYYFGLLKTSSMDNNTKKAFFFDQMQLKNRTAIGRPFINLSEIFCAADHGTTIGYSGSLPVLKEQVNDAAARWGLSDMRAGVNHFIDSVPVDLLDPSLNRYGFYIEVVAVLIEKLTKTPTREQADLLGAYVFSGDQLEEYLREFAPPLSLDNALRYLANDDYPTRSRITLWLEASLMRSTATVQSMFVQFADKLKWHADPAIASNSPCLLASLIIKYASLCFDQGIETTPTLHHLCVNSKLRTIVQNPNYNDIDDLCFEDAYKLALGATNNEIVYSSSLKSEFSTQSVPNARLNFKIDSSPHFVAQAKDLWRYTQSNTKQKPWRAVIAAPGPTAGRTFVGCLRLTADRAMTINISFGQHSKTEHEEITRRIEIMPNVSQYVKLNKKFIQTHTTLSLEIDILNISEGDTAEMKINNFGVTESIHSISNRLDQSKIDFRTANRLFREGEFATAFGIYLLLIQKHKLDIYICNAIMTANRLGMPWVKNQSCLALFNE